VSNFGTGQRPTKPAAAARYRSEIDGLRAIAVLSVVLYHFGIPGFTGGFVGVDIFFVISGFLIGGILWREYVETGSVWMLHFYVRRFRRLAPAFFVMALVVSGVAWLLLLPFEFREFGKTLIASTVYLSNVLFYRGAGYFDTGAEEKVLLHTWSLAVEEQFYIFLPVFILVLARFRRAIVPLLGVILFGSLVASLYLTPRNQPATFFLFPFRAWEMLSGVLLAIAGQRFGLTWKGFAPLSFLGLAILVWSIFKIQPDDRFPGFFAIAPVVGTLLILANGRGENMVNRMLSSTGPVFVGLISYSLYLWHWPVFTLSTYLRGSYANVFEGLAWAALSVGLGYLSWRYVELPVRRARNLPGAVVLVGAVAASAVLLGIGGYVYKNNGLEDRFGPTVLPHIHASADFLQDWSRCQVPTKGPLMGLEICPIGPEGDPEVLVWGDSHVRAFKEGLDAAAHEAGVPAMVIWRAGCPPLFDVRKVESYATAAEDLACSNANLQIKQAFNRIPSLRDIVLIGRWTYYTHGTGIGLDAENTIQILPKEGALALNKPQDEIVAKAIEATVKELYQRFENVWVIRQPPEVPFYDSRLAAKEAAHAGWPLAAAPVTQETVPTADAVSRASMAEAPFSKLRSEGWIRWIDFWPQLCSRGECHALIGGLGLYFDNNHMTNSAALALRGAFAPIFGQATAEAGQ